VPRWFPEVPDHEFLSFREACKALPVDAQRYLMRANKLGEHRLDGGLQPYVQRAGDAAPVSRSLGLSLDLSDLALLHEHSQVLVDGERVTLWFPREHVDSFLGWWEPMPQIIESTDPVPWEPKKTGRPGEEWHDLIAGAANEEEAKRRLPELPRGTERAFTDATGDRIRISETQHVTRKHFLKKLRNGRLKSDKE
jgi:hypothetical protein